MKLSDVGTSNNTDGIILSASNNLKAAQTADGLKLSNGGSSLLLYDVHSKPITLIEGGDTVRAMYVVDGTNVEGDLSVDRYKGLTRNSGVDFSAVDDDVMVDVTSYAFDNIGRVTLGAGDSTFVGDGHKETVTAGVGNDLIIISKGRDIIRNFDVENDRLIADAEFTVKVKGNDVLIKDNGGASALLVDLATVDAGISINDRLVKAGASMTYADDVTDYVGSKDATLNVNDDANVWLGLGNYTNVKTVDASNADGDVLIAGSDKSNVIIGGDGDNSLWGGIGGRDTLIGGAGSNEFYYGLGNGRDVIENANDDDIVNLLGIELDDIRNITVDDSSTAVKFNDGGRLLINSTANLTYRINGSNFKLDRNSSTFVQK